MNKKGIELTINFLVTIILSLVILSFGIVLVRNIFTGSEELSMSIDASVEAELKAAVASGKSVYVYPKTATINPSESQIFGVSVLNLDRDPLTLCRPSVSLSKVYTLENVDVTNNIPFYDQIAGWILDPEIEETLMPQDSTTFPIMIEPSGGGAIKDKIYVFDVKIKCGTGTIGQKENYGKTQKVYLTIK